LPRFASTQTNFKGFAFVSFLLFNFQDSFQSASIRVSLLQSALFLCQLLHSFLLLFCHLAFECLTIIPHCALLVNSFFKKNAI
jgi:hypothetical protein